MRKKLVWRLENLMSDTPAGVVKLQTIWASLTAILATSDYILAYNTHTIALLFVGGIVDKIVLGGLNYENVH
jgi:hypothetical protein